MNKSEKLKNIITKTLDENKAEDVIIIDLKGKTELADFMIIATGTSNRHVSALAEYVKKEIKKTRLCKTSIEGKENSDWVLIDTPFVITHIFKAEIRELYDLESLWNGDARP